MELSVIRKAIKINIIITEDIAEGKGAGNEEKRPPERTLGLT